jgi:hypothetical protein
MAAAAFMVVADMKENERRLSSFALSKTLLYQIQTLADKTHVTLRTFETYVP